MKTTNAQLSEKMQTSMADRVLVEEVIRAGLRWVQTYQDARMADELEDRFHLYDALRALAEHRK